MTLRLFLLRGTGLLSARDDVFFIEAGFVARVTWIWSIHIYPYQQGFTCMVNGVVHGGEFPLLCFVPLGCVCTEAWVCWMDTQTWHVCVCIYASVALDAGLVSETLLIAGNGEEMLGKEIKF